MLGRYRVVAPLARGGMGIVYLGRLEGAAGFSKPVVIKTVIPDAKDTEATQRFVREARILSNLEHPGIVGVLDFGEANGDYVMVLEYVHGFHLGNWWRYVMATRRSMPVAHAVEVMLSVLDALAFAHELKRPDGTHLGIVHRDISPANILIDVAGHVKLHDFGIARMADDEFKTQDGTFRGTLSFTAPETLHGVPAGPRSDLYACGVVLYQLLAGANPFRGDQPSETLHRVVTYMPPSLATLRDDVPAGIDAAITKALQKDPAARFESARQFAEALREARSWSEAKAAAELAQAIEVDFSSSELPKFLGEGTLQSRDDAWRATQGLAARVPLASSRPPKRRPEATETGEVVGQPDAQGGRGAVAQRAEGEMTVRAPIPPLSPSLLPASAATAQTAATPEVSASNEARSKKGLWFVAAGVAAVAIGGGAVMLTSRPAEPQAPRFVLIEKQDDTAASSVGVPPTLSASPGLEASAVPPTPTVARSAKPVVPGSGESKAGRGDASSAGLTAAFQRQRGRVEACFNAQAGDSPQLSLHFQVDASGAVRGADLAPSAVAASPLGACILAVARSTRFPASDGPVSFTIPIIARKKSN